MKTINSIALLAAFAVPATLAQAPVPGGAKGTAETTRYWDSCKVSCAWKDNISAKTPVNSCDKEGNILTDLNVQSACMNDGSAFACPSDQPFVDPEDPNLAYGFIAGKIAGQDMKTSCCKCLELTFKDQLVGKKMIVQLTNTGEELKENHFDIMLPGGGRGVFKEGVPKHIPGANVTNDWGGFDDKKYCKTFGPFEEGCNFRFEWFENANNPFVDYVEVECPAVLTEKSGCTW